MLPDYIRKEGKSILDDRWIIGLIVDNIDSEYSKDLIRDVEDALPMDGSIRLIVIASKYEDPYNKDREMRDYRSVYNSVMRLAEVCDLDGLLISHGGFIAALKKAEAAGTAGRISKLPRILFGETYEDEVIVRCDNKSGIRSSIDYLARVNGCRKICMLGGRDDNCDALERKECFIQSLRDNGIEFSANCYVGTNMSGNCEREAESLLERNPDMDAVFCINDSVAGAMYNVIRKRGLKPGRDVQIFGFDNTRSAGTMDPPLASIGTDGSTVGRKMLELLMCRLKGEAVESVTLSTRLYGRDSLDYDAYDYSSFDLMSVDEAFVDRMFDDCFYRYKNERYDREMVNLRLLFHEFISRITNAMQRRYMSNEEFGEILRLSEIFIENDATEYTDIRKLMNSIDRLQEVINTTSGSLSVNSMINRAFLRIKDRLIKKLASQKEEGSIRRKENREKLERFCIRATEQSNSMYVDDSRIIRNISELGLYNAAFFKYDSPLLFEYEHTADMPYYIRMCCSIKEGEFYLTTRDRQNGPVKLMFTRPELASMSDGFLVLPVCCGPHIYGYLLCGLSEDIYDRGGFVAAELGRALYLNEAIAEDGGESNSRHDSHQYRRASDRDPMLNMLNKKAITDYAQSVCREGKPTAYIVIFDLDHFKQANDTLGHAYGDEILSGVTEIINEAVGQRGVVGRIGGDEIMIVTRGMADKQELRPILREIRMKVEDTYKNISGNLSVTCSMGAAAYPDHGDSFSSVRNLADKMLYLAKEKGRNRYIIYTPEMHKELLESFGEGTTTGIDFGSTFDKIGLVRYMLEDYLRKGVTSNITAFSNVGQAFRLSEILIVYERGGAGFRWTPEGVTHTKEDLTWMPLDAPFFGHCDPNDLFVVDARMLIQLTEPQLERKLTDRDIQSALFYKLAHNGKIQGFVMFARKEQRQKWSEYELLALSTIARVFEMSVY